MSLPDWHADLLDKGYAIIPGVLTENECQTLETGFWDYWEHLTGGRLHRERPDTWKTVYDYYPNHGMLCQHFSIGHMPEIWNVRSHERVKRVYETIWGTKDLTVSFDGASSGFAPEITGRGWHRNHWLHLDQSPHRNGFECVQGWVTACDTGPGDGTLTLLEGSHKLHGAFAKRFGLHGDKKYRSDWLKLESEHLDWYKAQGCQQINVECPKGSMVLWESRTVHAGRSAVKGRANRRNRFVAYISMMPANLLTPRERLKKQRACLEGRMTSHWAASRVKLFAKHPRTYGKPLPEVPAFEPPLFTEEQARLAGWDNPSECPLLIKDSESRKQAVKATLARMDMRKKKRKRKLQVN